MKYTSLFSPLTKVKFLAGINSRNHSSNSSENQREDYSPLVLSSFKLVKPLPKTPKQMMVYKTITPKLSFEEIRLLMKAFNLQGEISDNQKQIVVRDRDKVLEVFKEPGTGYLRFSNDEKLGVEKVAENLPSENEAISKAEGFLKANGLLPENAYFSGVGYYEFMKYDLQGEKVAQGKSALAVGFGFKIEDMKVEGPGAKAGVVFGERGEIIGASKIWREITPDKEIKILTAEEAFAKFKQRWPKEAKPEQLKKADIKTEVLVNEVYLTYYAKPGCLPQKQLLPIYVFRGEHKTSGKIQDSDDFKIIIPAIT